MYSTCTLLPTLLSRQVHDFSKMLFGVAGLMPDMVRAVPVWIDDPYIQRVLYANVLEHGVAGSDTLLPELARAASNYFAEEGSLLQQEAAGGLLETYPSESGPAVSPAGQWGQLAGQEAQNGGSSKTVFGIAGWQAKLAERVRSNVYRSKSQVRSCRRWPACNSSSSSLFTKCCGSKREQRLLWACWQGLLSQKTRTGHA